MWMLTNAGNTIGVDHEWKYKWNVALKMKKCISGDDVWAD